MLNSLAFSKNKRRFLKEKLSLSENSKSNWPSLPRIINESSKGPGEVNRRAIESEKKCKFDWIRSLFDQLRLIFDQLQMIFDQLRLIFDQLRLNFD